MEDVRVRYRINPSSCGFSAVEMQHSIRTPEILLINTINSYLHFSIGDLQYQSSTGVTRQQPSYFNYRNKLN